MQNMEIWTDGAGKRFVHSAGGKIGRRKKIDLRS